MMKKIPCPICTHRLFDSNTKVTVSKSTSSKEEKQMISLKCPQCKNILTIHLPLTG